MPLRLRAITCEVAGAPGLPVRRPLAQHRGRDACSAADSMTRPPLLRELLQAEIDAASARPRPVRRGRPCLRAVRRRYGRDRLPATVPLSCPAPTTASRSSSGSRDRYEASSRPTRARTGMRPDYIERSDAGGELGRRPCRHRSDQRRSRPGDLRGLRRPLRRRQRRLPDGSHRRLALPLRPRRLRRHRSG